MELVDNDLTLRRPTDADAGALAATVIASLASLEPWMPWASAAYDEAAALEWIRNGVDPTEHGFVIVDGDGTILGSCGLHRIDGPNARAELGYWVATDRSGRGLATRAARLLVRYGFDHLGLHRVEIVMSTENERSRRVAERIGATHEGVARGRLRLHGRHHDVHVYGILAGEIAEPG